MTTLNEKRKLYDIIDSSRQNEKSIEWRKNQIMNITQNVKMKNDSTKK